MYKREPVTDGFLYTARWETKEWIISHQANRRSLAVDAGTSASAQMNRWASPYHGQFLPAEGTEMDCRTLGGRVARLRRVYRAREVHLYAFLLHQDFSHLERQYGPSWEFPALLESHAS